ncbi:hypothetical protein [Pseudosulfitobacter pseudonitzschiae]|nr:hypothetical protein [Pseudosulfitobacter pseudonitzschiae]MBM1817835.1 hypothetical protein [Pseudosulfitobacter pseudonitzschiae]MBM1834892.1 hypothetical protein [Pseudosulfitobacter pseudonitzschiae]MBM1839693.1 hypothetical protein [Pseudosulfitobacter pseudonitzschiae]MBM1844608.1 hypothetical protein [Pseudosulfitobacter pseudonitzschiae]MBM1849379.1 hypothetical protein [Pseudosulfitobacter pseudonitzschiae]
MIKPIFSYPDHDENLYLSWFKDSFSSVFVATNPFLNIPDFPLNPQGEWIPDEVNSVAKQRGADAGISWQKISMLCGFPSIAYVNRALGLTGSKRLSDKFSCPADTATMLKLCREQNIFIPDEGFLSPLSELSLASFLKELEHDEVIVADHFGTSPRPMKSEKFLKPEVFPTPEIYAQDKSIYVSIYTDYHYFLVCQTDASRSKANPANYFDGFFANENTNDLWGVSDLS